MSRKKRRNKSQPKPVNTLSEIKEKRDGGAIAYNTPTKTNNIFESLILLS